jgi:hypothetical protein
VERITEASGIEGAKAREEAARDALREEIDRIMVADDRAIAGAVIKAQALAAWAEVEPFYRVANARGPAWAELPAASIVKHAAFER